MSVLDVDILRNLVQIFTIADYLVLDECGFSKRNGDLHQLVPVLSTDLLLPQLAILGVAEFLFILV